MPHGVPDAVEVEADPSAVFDAHGAESVEELLESGPSDAEAACSDDQDVAVASLFAEGFAAPERESPADPTRE